MLDDRIFTSGDYDRQTQRLEWAAKLQGCSREEIADLISARENERQRLVALIAEEEHGPQCAD